MRVILVITILILSVTIFGKTENEKITTHQFGETEVEATKSGPNSLNIDILKTTNTKTKINTKENFLVEMSESIEDID